MKENNEVTLKWGYDSKRVTRYVYMSEEINVMEENYQWCVEGDRGCHWKVYVCYFIYGSLGGRQRWHLRRGKGGTVILVHFSGSNGKCMSPDMQHSWIWNNFWRPLDWWEEAKERGIEQVREVVKARTCSFLLIDGMTLAFTLNEMRSHCRVFEKRYDMIWSVF